MQKVQKLSVLGLISLFAVNIAYMSDLVIVPAADAIFTQFADAPVGVLNFILTGPQLVSIFSALLTSVLMRKFSKKIILVGSFALFTVAALLGTVVMDPYYIALMCGIMGFAFGATAPTAIALINEVYRDDEKKANGLVGTFNGVTAIVGAVLSIAAGVLGAMRWQNVYYIFYAAIPFLILMAFTLPGIKPAAERKEREAGTGAGAGKGVIRKVAALVGSILVICIVFNVMSYQCAIYAVQEGLGDSMFAGILSSVCTVTTAVGCILCAALYGRLGRKVACLLYGILALGFLGCCFVLGQWWAIVCFAVMGFGFGLAMTYFYIHAAAIAPENTATVAGVIAAAVGLGSFLSSYVNTALMGIFNMDKIISVLPVYVGVLTVGGVVSLVLALREQKISGAGVVGTS